MKYQATVMEQPRFIICSQCGAENRPSDSACRMCQTPLVGAEQVRHEKAKAPELLSTMTFSTQQGEPLVCPSCHEPNEAGYKFCSNCGSNLRRSQAETIIDKGMAPPRPQQEAPPRPQQEAAPPQAPRPQSLPPQPPQPPPPQPEPRVSGRLQERASEAVAERPDYLRTVPAGSCTRCGSQLMAGSMFCHKCGSPVSASHTVAIASVRPQPRPRLLLIIEGEQTGDEYDLKGETVIGRVTGDITFPHDDYMSGRHARIEKREKKFVLIDEGSRNGSFVRIKKEVEIEPGDMILIGRQVFRFEI